MDRSLKPFGLALLGLVIVTYAYAAEIFSVQKASTVPGANDCVTLPVSGAYYVRATAWDAEGNQSALSNEVLKTFPAANPVCWTNPTENVDGSQLTDLTRITVYYSTDRITGGGTPPAVPELGLPTQDGATAFAGNMLVGVTGRPVTVPYTGNGDMQLELVEYGGSSATLSGTSSSGSWTFTPTRAGLYFVRIRPVGGEWAASNEDQLFYFKLAAPGGGGIN